VAGATLLGLVVTGLGPDEPEPPELAEPEGDETAPLGDPELPVVGLVKLLVGLVKLLVGLVKLLAGLVKLLVTGLPLAPAELPEPAEPDAAEANPLGDAAPAVVGVRPAGEEPVTSPELPVPEAPVPVAAVPEPVGSSAGLEVTGLVALKGAEAPAPPLATVFGVATPVDIWITGTGPVENLPDPVAVTPLPSTLYISWYIVLGRRPPVANQTSLAALNPPRSRAPLG
jgi:hypothetical protein